MKRGSALNVTFWRMLLLAFCLCCAAAAAVSLFSGSVEASSALGFQVARTNDNGIVRINAVDPGGAAESSGLIAGDLIHLNDLTPGDRYRLLTGVYAHERIPVTVTRAGRVLKRTYVSGATPAWRWDVWVFFAASVWMIAFASLIAWRRADSVEARILCVVLALNPASAALLSGSWIGPSPLADVVTAGAGYTLTWVCAALFATYASLFARPPSPVRRALTFLAYASSAAVSMYEVVRLAEVWTGGRPWVAQTFGPDWNIMWAAVPYVVVLLCAWTAIAAARGQERGRIAWTTATLGVLYLAQAMAYVVPLILPEAQHGAALVVAYQCINVGSFLAPLGMTYALFSRRLVDVGFALNRVAVFSGVSIVIVGLFVLAEWAVGAWLSGSGHAANLIADAGIALALGFSIRFVHARVELVLDRVFFRKRHEDEQAIRRFAHEAAYVTDRDVLLARTASVLERNADASSVMIALDDGAGRYGTVDENDPAILSLRTWRRPIDLHDSDSQMTGEYAYPMVARGRLLGVIVLGPKRSQEAYAPDESDAIEELANGAAGALDVLSNQRSEISAGDVMAAIHALSLRIDAINPPCKSEPAPGT